MRWQILYMVYFFLMAAIMFILESPRLHDIALALSMAGLLFISPFDRLRSFRNALEMIVLFFILVFIYRKSGLFQVYFITQIITLVIFYLYIFKIKKFKPFIDIFKAGKIKGSILLSLIFAILSVTGLVFWFINQTGNPHEQYMPHLPIYILPVLGVLFALLNSLFEETIFRGILLPCFSESTGWVPAVIMQAIWFSFLHYQAGFPSGIMGIVLTLTFAIMMVVLLKRTGGILLPVIVHAIADFSIFLLILARNYKII